MYNLGRKLLVVSLYFALNSGLLACHIDATGRLVSIEGPAIAVDVAATWTPVCCADQAHYVTPTPEPTLGGWDYQPVPWPVMADVGEPLLDQIRFVNARLVQLPNPDPDWPAALTQWSWSPTGEQLMLMAEWEWDWIGNRGMPSANTWLVDLISGRATSWQTNALWPTWSRDGRSIFYQVLVVDAIAFYTDLYERQLDEATGQLLVRSVGMTDLYQPSAIDASNGDLIFNNADSQPVLLPAGVRFGLSAKVNDKIYPLLLADLAHKSPPRDEQDKIMPTRFLLAPGGEKVAMLPFSGAFYILDLVHATVIAEFADAWHSAGSAAWSMDSQAVAFANHQGVFVYDLPQHETRTLITRQDLQFPSDSFWDSFGVFTWSPDNKVVLFQAFATDWRAVAKQGREARIGRFTFGALADGTQRRPLLAEAIESFAPDRHHAIIQRWDEVTQQYQAYLVDVEWGK